jgi:L-ascorbate metabolism protein UlaG (beta-lactamase superfamily)
VDLAETLRGKGVKLVEGNIGGNISFPFGSARFFQAIHGSGAPGTLSSGFVFDMGGKKIYHAGDTALMMDMQLLAYDKLDAALLPIGDFYTMGPVDAVRAAEMIKAKVTIPMHFNTFPHITQDPYKFAESVQALGLKAEVMKVGEEIVL